MQCAPDRFEAASAEHPLISFIDEGIAQVSVDTGDQYGQRIRDQRQLGVYRLFRGRVLADGAGKTNDDLFITYLGDGTVKRHRYGAFRIGQQDRLTLEGAGLPQIGDKFRPPALAKGGIDIGEALPQ